MLRSQGQIALTMIIKIWEFYESLRLSKVFKISKTLNCFLENWDLKDFIRLFKGFAGFLRI